MKRIITLITFTLMLTSLKAQFLVEDFNFSGGILGVNGWSATAVSPGTPALMTTSVTGLTYTGFSGTGIGNAANIGASGEDLTKALPGTLSTGALYMTFMINVSSAGSTGDYITGFTSGGPTYFTNYNLRLYVKSVTGGIDFGVSRGSITTAPATPAAFTGNVYNLNQTYLITCKYEWISPGLADDVCRIYIHPTIPSLTEPAMMSASQSGSSGLNDGTISAIFLRQGSSATATTVTSVLDGFRVATTWEPTIPVELFDFKAQKENATVKLLWSTATELNNAYYAIERSENGKSFDKIGEVSGYGNSQLARSYSFVDAKPMNGINYYRLRQVDFDGKETVYKTVSVNFGKNTTTKVYPSIAKDKINVEISSDNSASDLLVVNLLGQVVKAQKLQNTEGVFSVNISDLPNGSYIMRLISKNESVSQRFEKQ